MVPIKQGVLAGGVWQAAMVSDLIVRPRTDADVDALVAILRFTHAADAYPMRASNVRAGWLYDESFERAWVAESTGSPVGHIAVVRGHDNAAVSAALRRPASEILGITRLFVGPAARGLGAASALMDVADEYAASVALPLALDVLDESTAAIALYERRGWTRVWTGPAEWVTPDGTHPLVHEYVAPLSRG
jgi:GNAT superfamily N-acetyltransferase